MRLDWAVIKRHPELVQVGAEIWLALASSGAHIVSLTKDSAIWTDEEKFRYSRLSDAGDGIAHVLNFVVPERYLRMTEFQTFAEQNNLFIIKHSESRPSVFKETTPEEKATTIALVYLHGAKDVPKDYVKAHMWFSLAARRASDVERRDAAIKNLESVAAKMTQAQSVEAQKLAQDWEPKPEH
jgi:TPR repeat protein